MKWLRAATRNRKRIRCKGLADMPFADFDALISPDLKRRIEP